MAGLQKSPLEQWGSAVKNQRPSVCIASNVNLQYDRALPSRNVALYGVIIAGLLGAGCLVLGVLFTHTVTLFPIYGRVLEALPLVLNVVITLLNEAMGFLHGASLRWALQHESRLHFHTNLRLFTSAQGSPPNRWYSNGLMLTGLVLSYGSASHLLVQCGLCHTEIEASVFGPAFLLLGVGLATQCLVTMWSFYTTPVPTWSTNPLDTLKACRAMGLLQHVPGRSLRSSNESEEPTQPVLPRQRQASMLASHRGVRIVLYIIMLMTTLGGLWIAIVVAVAKARTGVDTWQGWTGDWSIFLNTRTATEVLWTVRTPLKPPDNYISWLSASANLLFALVFQAAITFTLHCAELLVNLSRDEQLLRRASRNRKGLPQVRNSVLAACTSWQTLGIGFFKISMHWLFGTSMALVATNDVSSNIIFHPVQMIYLTGLGGLLFLAALGVSLWRSRGPQPTAFGHLQTMADLIDDFPCGNMYWGHKGVDASGWGQAGTSDTQLQQIVMDWKYL